MDILNELDASVSEDFSSDPLTSELTSKEISDLKDELKRQLGPIKRKHGELKR